MQVQVSKLFGTVHREMLKSNAFYGMMVSLFKLLFSVFSKKKEENKPKKSDESADKKPKQD